MNREVLNVAFEAELIAQLQYLEKEAGLRSALKSGLNFTKQFGAGVMKGGVNKGAAVPLKRAQGSAGLAGRQLGGKLNPFKKKVVELSAPVASSIGKTSKGIARAAGSAKLGIASAASKVGSKALPAAKAVGYTAAGVGTVGIATAALAPSKQ